VKGRLPVRLASLLLGLFIWGVAVVSILESHLGLPPWDVLHQGIARHTPISFGAANIVVGSVVLVAAWLLGTRPGLGTVMNTALVGTFIQLLLAIGWVAHLHERPLADRIGLLAFGILITGAGSAFYIGASLGAGPRDSLMLAGAHRLGRRVGVVRTVIELGALAAGVALGGTFGIGTAVYALSIGPVVEAGFWSLQRVGLAVPEPAEALLLPE
jgi:uncharacterized membrane protein YczE